MSYEIAPDFCYITDHQGCVRLTSIHPKDDRIFKMGEVESEMFLYLIKAKKSPAEVVQAILNDYDSNQQTVRQDLDKLITFLLSNEIITEKAQP